MKIKQAVLYGAGDLRIEDQTLDDGPLLPDQIYVESEVTALSTGTELGNYLGRSTDVPGAPDYPRTVGYANVGVIRLVGSDVTDLRVGQRVFSNKPHQSGYVAKASELLVPVPEPVTPDEASLAYFTQLGLSALRQARYEAGENVAVIGLGTIGLCTVGVARAMGAKVVGIANSAVRAEAARRVGAHAGLLFQDSGFEDDLKKIFGDVGPDVVVLTANTWDAYRRSVEMARCGGRISILGFPGRGQPSLDFNPLDPCWLYAKQLTLIGTGSGTRLECAAHDVRFNLRRNLVYILDLMANRALQLGTLITHRFPHDRMTEAYELAREHSKDLITAIFDWRSPEEVRF